MYVDKRLELSDGQALSATGASTNVADLGAAGDLGAGEAMALVVQCDVALAGTSPTLNIKLQKDTVAAMSSPEDVIQWPQLTAMAVGEQLIIPIPPGAADQRFTRAYYTLGGTTPSVTLSAFIAPMSEVQHWKAYPDSPNIS